jgi:hypothetical protein
MGHVPFYKKGTPPRGIRGKFEVDVYGKTIRDHGAQ